MNRKTINYYLDLADVNHKDIAARCQPPVSRAAVTRVIGGSMISRRIQEEIARSLSRDVEELFPGNGNRKERICRKGIN